MVLMLGLWTAPDTPAQEKPQKGGVLRVALAGDPPSLDMHQESTFMVDIPMSPVYNGLIAYDPNNFPEVMGDLAKKWELSDDKLSWTFTLHEGVKFHDGSPLTSADVKASWDRIIDPPKGIVSPRKKYFTVIKNVEAPEPYKVVFHLKQISPAVLTMIAHPANFIFSKKKLDEDPQWYKTHTLGTGPYTLKEYRRGSFIELQRYPKYWKNEILGTNYPYMDGLKYYIIRDDGARAKAIRADRADVELRGFPPAEVEAIKNQMGAKATVGYPARAGNWGVAFNHDKKPFDDKRVRLAMSLAIDRYDMAKTLGPLSGLDIPAGPLNPDNKWGLTSEELQELPGFGKDHEANLKEAKRLLAEAGYPNGFKTELLNRGVKLPYIDFGVYLVSQWKKVGIEATHRVEESATWSKARRARDFEVFVNPNGSSTGGEPDEVLSRYTTDSPQNYGRFSDAEVDKLFKAQTVELDPEKRLQLVKDLQRRVITEALWMPCLGWTRAEVRSARIKNYTPLPSHWMNRRMEDVWLAKE
jgi:peptide/nickel transport system substrate-binding protein